MRFLVRGDGPAGLTLAFELERRGHSVRLAGAGSPQAPEVAIVHLYAGRSFRRRRLELEAFGMAVEHWRRCPEAVELPVRRWGQTGDRLERSEPSLELAESRWAGWQPTRDLNVPAEAGVAVWRYGPGFAIRTAPYLRRLAQGLRQVAHDSILESDEVEILALGWALQERLPRLDWDRSDGLVQKVAFDRDLDQGLYIGAGFHLAVSATGGVGWLGGGRGCRREQQQAAQHCLALRLRSVAQWRGRRLAPALDRSPLLGWIGDRSFVFGGFGSRGFFWLPYCAKVAATALEHGRFCDGGDPIPDGLRLQRALGFGSGTSPP